MPDATRAYQLVNAKTILAALLLALAAGANAQLLSPLADAPDWSKLERFQETITRDAFTRLLNNVYAPNDAANEFIEIRPAAAHIKTTLEPAGTFVLRFGDSRTVPRYWTPKAQLPAPPTGRPLDGLHVAIDPGHIGGKWALMEERWFRIGDAPPVTEGDMTLWVARKLAPLLEALGARVSLVRDSDKPIARTSPRRLRKIASAELERKGVAPIRKGYDGPADPLRSNSVNWQSELLFYRTAEIRARAEIVNDTLKPDITLCLHFNAEAWGDPKNPTLVEKNHLHFLVNGCYSAAELAYDDVRFGMLEQLLSRTYAESLAASDTVALSMARATGLPPYEYPGTNAIHVGETGYVWARNLLANRLYLCPVIYAEPYVMNSQEVHDRIQLGDYAGTRDINGVSRKSIFAEYADSVAEGLAEYYRAPR